LSEVTAVLNEGDRIEGAGAVAHFEVAVRSTDSRRLVLFGSNIIGLVNVSVVKASNVVVKSEAGRFPESQRHRTNCCLVGH
jgi:hypothetical protein